MSYMLMKLNTIAQHQDLTNSKEKGSIFDRVSHPSNLSSKPYKEIFTTR